MNELKFCAVILNTGELLECETFRPIWGALKYHVDENPRIEIYISGVHVSTIAAAPNGRIYYRRIGSLKQFDVTAQFARFAD